MSNSLIKVCNRIIEYSFYALFLLVPLAFTSSTFELFEFNKMWLTFALTIIIGGSWFIKSTLQRQLRIQRTPLDIPILLFLLSQIVSTLFSWDRHVSLWGYYSRFNGGLLSIMAYIFLYYAFLSNLGNLIVLRLLKVSLFSGLIVALWGLPSHFGFDPTCLIFRGSFDVSCWTEAFQPKVRIFSTLGQPDWLAAYLAILLPIGIAMGISNVKFQMSNNQLRKSKNWKFEIGNYLKLVIIFLLPILFYLDLLFTDSRSGFLAVWTGLIFFIGIVLLPYLRPEIRPLRQLITYHLSLITVRYLLTVLILLGGVTFIVGTPFHQLDRLTFPGIKSELSKITKSKETKAAQKQTPAKAEGGTESGQIRSIVWRGAIDAWKNNPLFGTGVETFAFAYYRYRPVEHNLVSEWDFLYNKAHNEYLNYLATTGIFGLGSYLLMIGLFLSLSLKQISKSEFLISNQPPNPKPQPATPAGGLGQLEIRSIRNLLPLALLAGYLSILITNFFGFSVVIVSLYFFLIPAFVFVLQGIIDPKRVFLFPKQKSPSEQNLSSFIFHLSSFQWVLIVVVLLSIFYLLFNLFKFWLADRAYALGYNLDRVGQYQEAYPKLHEAVALRGDEPVFKDELAINDAILASALGAQKEATTAAFLTSEAVKISDELTSKHPNNVVFAKTRVRVFYALSQVDQKYLGRALETIIAAQKLAPTDAKISYNLGLLYGQNGATQKAVETLEKTIKLKPDYRDAYYALGLFYYDLGVNKNGRIIRPEFRQKAVETMRYLMKVSQGQDEQAQKSLKGWGEM